MKQDELDKLRALHEAATPGPWQSTKYGYEKHSINGDRGVEIASCWRKQNAELIATMHANWLDLIAQAERANALEAALGKGAKEIAAEALQSACESDPADPDHPDTICITTGDFETIVRCAVENWQERTALERTGADHG